MKLIIASSKSWFKIDEKIYNQHEVMEITKSSELTKVNIDNFCPNFIFFPIGVGLSQKVFICPTNAFYFILPLCHMDVVEAPSKI